MQQPRPEVWTGGKTCLNRLQQQLEIVCLHGLPVGLLKGRSMFVQLRNQRFHETMSVTADAGTRREITTVFLTNCQGL